MSTAAISLHYIWDIPSHFCFCFCFLLLLGLCLFRKSMVFSSRNSGRMPVLARCSDGRINATRWYCVYSCVTNATGSSWIKLAHTRWTIKHSRENLKKKKMRIKCVCVWEKEIILARKRMFRPSMPGQEPPRTLETNGPPLVILVICCCCFLAIYAEDINGKAEDKGNNKEH